MGNPLTDCQKLRDKLLRAAERKQIAYLELEQENEQLRKVIAAIDTRLDMQLMFFTKVMGEAGTLSEAKRWWFNFIGEIGEAEANSGGDISLESINAIRDKHGLHWHDEYTAAVRVQKNIEWLGYA